MDQEKMSLVGNTTIIGCCFRMLISRRKNFIKSRACYFGLGSACTLLVLSVINIGYITVANQISNLHYKEIGDDQLIFRNLTNRRIIPAKAELMNSQNSVADESITTLVKKIDMSNLTKPWFTIFSADKHLDNFTSYFTKRNNLVTILPKSYALDVNIDCEKNRTVLLVLIPSVVEDAVIRGDIRRTWASIVYGSKYNQSDIAKVIFFFGDSALEKVEKEKLQSESEEFSDIVTIDMVDSYKNLSLKISSMLQWSAGKCPSANFVAKVDMDTWINIPLMIKLLENLINFNTKNNISASTVGFKHAYNIPQAVHSGKWEIPVSIYPYETLPRYVYGHSYVLSRKAVDAVVSALPYFPIIPNEDAFITGIMSLVSNVTRVHSPAFAHLFEEQTYLDVQNNRYASSIHSENNLLDIWKQIKIHNATNNTLH